MLDLIKCLPFSDALRMWKKSDFPELADKSLTVHLACGYGNTYTYGCIDADGNAYTGGNAASCNFYGSLEGGNYLYDDGCRTYVDTGPSTELRLRAITDAVFSKSSEPGSPSTCMITFRDQSADRYQFASFFQNPKIYPVVLYPNQDTVLFEVPKLSGAFDSSAFAVASRFRRKGVRCSIIGAAYELDPGSSGPKPDGTYESPEYEDTIVDEEMLTPIVEISDHQRPGKSFHSVMRSVWEGQRSPSYRGRDGADEIASALYYTYRWGWQTGFIEMPHYSIQELLSTPPPNPTGSARVFSDVANKNQNDLQRYQLLASLFVSEGDPLFESENFGLLTPGEAEKKYRNNYTDRFDSYFGLTLGGFLKEVAPEYRQQ